MSLDKYVQCKECLEPRYMCENPESPTQRQNPHEFEPFSDWMVLSTQQFKSEALNISPPSSPGWQKSNTYGEDLDDPTVKLSGEFRVPISVKRRLETFCKDEGISRANLIRALVLNFLESQ